MEENARLRTLIRDLGGFMGEGMGGPLLDRTGWTMAQFKDFINRADSDTAYESFIKAKAGAGASTSNSASHAHAQSGEPEGSGGRKRKRDSATPASADPLDGPSSSRAPSRAYNPGSASVSRGGRAQSPSELHSLLPMGGDRDPFRERTSRDGDGAPNSFTSLVDTLNSSAGAPFVSLTRSSHNTVGSSAGPTPTTTSGYSPENGGYATGYGAGRCYSILLVWLQGGMGDY